MAELPPRKNSSPVKSKQNLVPLQLLLQMGFSKHRAEKALAATGHRGVQLASDWLLAHVNDSTVDLQCPREYALYLCPTGPLNELVEGFWNDSLSKCGWNAAHNLVPHITLCPFFKCLDENCEFLVTSLKTIIRSYLSSGRFPSSLTLDKYVSPNYMGLFLSDSDAEVFQELARNFMRDMANIDSSFGSLETLKKELHLTLAYGFASVHFSKLESLVSNVDSSAPAGWEVRLYSRDSRIVGNEVYKVLYSHVPRQNDELELLIGDFVYINRDVFASSMDGWVEGTSWLTGCYGFLPLNYIEKTAESDAWTLHCAISVIGGATSTEKVQGLGRERPKISLSLLNLLENSEGSRRSTDLVSDTSSIHSRQVSTDMNPPVDSCHYTSQNKDKHLAKSAAATLPASVPSRAVDLDALYSKVDLEKKRRDSEAKASGDLCKAFAARTPSKSPRKLIVVRHGERVDFTFGDWVRFCFDENGKYDQKDLNMPAILPKREGAPRCFYKDCPLTNIGLTQALLLGEGMRASKVEIDHVFCSPSLRCVQTCTNILKGLGIVESASINIEPGLFEWLAWHVETPPMWMTIQEFKEFGFNINADYNPLIRTEELLREPLKETCEEFYKRSHYVTKSILSQTQNVGGTVLMVAHAASVDTCCRQLVGGPTRSPHALTMLLKKIPYCSFSYCVEDSFTGAWQLKDPPFNPVTHSQNIRYEWNALSLQEQ